MKPEPVPVAVAGKAASTASKASAGSQAGAYAALLFGGILLVAATKGDSIRNVLTGVRSPLRGLTTPIPSSFPSSGGAGSKNTASRTVSFIAPSPGAGGAVQLAKSWIGTNEGSKRQSAWASRYGVAPTVAWCSEFIAEVLRGSGVKNLPSNPLYSGSWLEWKGGTNLHTTNLAKARPGDLLIFDWGDGGITDHVGIYAGHGRYVAGNNSDNSVGEAPVPTGNVVGIVRPHYPSTGKGLL